MADWKRTAAAMRRLSGALMPPADDIGLLGDGVADLILRKLGSPKCDLWWFLREKCGYSDAAIRRHLWQKQPAQPNELPPLLWLWKEQITTALLGRCECAERYHDPRDQRKYKAMARACKSNHALSELNGWLGTLTPKWIKSIQERMLLEEHWLKRAVDGDSNLHQQRGGIYRAFGNSMLCAVFTTPAESGLYLTADDVLTDARGLVPNRDQQWDRLVDQRGEPGVLAWFCGNCRQIVGQSGRGCMERRCYWEPRRVYDDDSAQWPYYEASVVRCSEGHYLPARGLTSCPAPGCSGTLEGRRQKIFGFGVDKPDAGLMP